MTQAPRGRAVLPLSGLAPGGVYRAARVTPGAGALLPHRCTLACADRSPGPPSAVCSLWHCPAGRPDWVLPSTVPCGVRTFLGRVEPVRGRPATSPPRPAHCRTSTASSRFANDPTNDRGTHPWSEIALACVISRPSTEGLGGVGWVGASRARVRGDHWIVASALARRGLLTAVAGRRSRPTRRCRPASPRRRSSAG